MRLRGGRFYVRRHVPCDLQAPLNRVELWRSLKTDSLQTALRRMPAVMAGIEAEFDRVRAGIGATADDANSRLPTVAQPIVEKVRVAAECPASVSSNGLTLAEAYQQYVDDPTHRWSASTRQSYDTCRKLAISVIGGDVPMGSFGRTHCRDFLDVLRHLPRNANKRFPKLTAREASQRARERGDVDVISAANANVNLANLSSFLNWAVNEELLTRNPMRGLRLHDDVAKKDKRNPFSADQLRKIFDAPLYTGCLDGGRGYAKPGVERPRNARFWVPLIALHSGMRLNEICQLDVADIRLIDGIWCFVVCDNSLVGSDDKALKTAASERFVPIHSRLIGFGLIAYAEQQRRARALKLFGEIDPGPKGKRAVAFSKWFTQFSRACGAYEERTCFHSFRHNFRDALRAAKVDHDLALALGGWSNAAGVKGVSENYGNGYSIPMLRDAMELLSFPHVNV
ncbi:site-specific integrase [Novosphingobium sp. BL-8H]|uniref:DUF6538 domain-containing protein n=1 Tax=Novosphingobium sp. BL-8H TaxID=3127640 RepID=UPI003757993A